MGILELSKNIISRHLKINAIDINENSTLPELGADSLDCIEIIVEIESALNIIIHCNNPSKLYNSTIKQLCNYIIDFNSSKQKSINLVL